MLFPISSLSTALVMFRLSFVCIVLAQSISAFAEQPNIVLIMADDLGRECLGCYGGESYQTPHIDSLAEQGTRFEACYATPMCSPTRVMLMTGRYSFQNYTEWGKMDFNQPALAKLLKSVGYQTAIFGKWHLGGWESAPYGPTQAGFDQYATFDYEQVVREGGKVGNQFWKTKVWENGKNFRLDGYGPKYYREHSLQFIRSHAAKDAKPFFLYYPLVLAHRPFVPTDLSRSPVAEKTARNGELKNFPSMVEYIDSIVGEIVAELKRSGLDDSTVIIFTADNGTDAVHEAKQLRSEYRGTSVAGGKYHPSELGANVPLIVCGPAVKTGQVLVAPVDFTDLLPTLCEVAGANIPATADGHSLLTTLATGDESSHDGLAYTWGVFQRSSKKYKDPRKYQSYLLHIVRDRDWKLLSNGQLYQLQEDWQELSPISKDANLDVRSRLNGYLKELRASSYRLW